MNCWQEKLLVKLKTQGRATTVSFLFQPSPPTKLGCFHPNYHIYKTSFKPYRNPITYWVLLMEPKYLAFRRWWTTPLAHHLTFGEPGSLGKGFLVFNPPTQSPRKSPSHLDNPTLLCAAGRWFRPKRRGAPPTTKRAAPGNGNQEAAFPLYIYILVGLISRNP